MMRCYLEKDHLHKGRRKASGLSIVPDARVAVGVSITDRHLRLTAVDLRMKELGFRKTTIGPIDALCSSLAKELELFLDAFSIDRDRLLGVGIALPAIIDLENRFLRYAPTLSLREAGLSGGILLRPPHQRRSGDHAVRVLRRSGAGSPRICVPVA